MPTFRRKSVRKISCFSFLYEKCAGVVRELAGVDVFAEDGVYLLGKVFELGLFLIIKFLQDKIGAVYLFWALRTDADADAAVVFAHCSSDRFNAVMPGRRAPDAQADLPEWNVELVVDGGNL